MAHTPHPHDHRHEDHGFFHEADPREQQQMDAATRSLNEALRLSFRLLSLIMVVVLVLFLGTGVRVVEEGERGIVKVFGKVTRLAEPGLTITWPFPIGEIEVVSTDSRELTVQSFWMYEEPGEELELLSERRPSAEGLRPGWDGALFTGDQSLYHTKLSCTYTVQEPERFRRNVGSDADGEELLRNLLSNAAVVSAARQTADSINVSTGEFIQEVRSVTQQRLDDLEAGVRVDQVQVPARTWPLRALSAYDAAQRARSQRDQVIDRARGRAQEILNSAAGRSYRTLVGAVFGDAPPDQDEESLMADQNLIGQYTDALAREDETEAAVLLKRINRQLLSNETGGRAARILAEAQTYRSALVQKIQSRVDRFRKLLAIEDRELLLRRLWADTREEILSTQTLEKYYISVKDGRTVVHIGPDPEVVRQIRRERLEQQENAEQQE